VPAGTLLRCTLDEPNFSSATADIGDPVICHLNNLREFGQNAFPRGSYLGGHLEADKEPGHFVGKGYLKLNSTASVSPIRCPVPSKVIAARDTKWIVAGTLWARPRDARHRGMAHSSAMAWKILMLPARGPRPTLKAKSRSPCA